MAVYIGVARVTAWFASQLAGGAAAGARRPPALRLAADEPVGAGRPPLRGAARHLQVPLRRRRAAQTAAAARRRHRCRHDDDEQPAAEVYVCSTTRFFALSIKRSRRRAFVV